MSLKINPPHRAEHLGSLKRPQYLLEKRVEFDNSKCTAEELKVTEDEAIRAIVQMQREAGMKTITDGEFRRCVSMLLCSKVCANKSTRHMFYDGVFDNLDGMAYIPEGTLLIALSV